MKKSIDTAVILAAGRGTRLQPYTHHIPKGFMQVGGETLIGRSIRLLKTNGIAKIIIGTGHLSKQYAALAQSEGLKTFKSPDFATTGSFHTLCCGKELIHSDFLLLESDLLYHENAIRRLLDHPANDVVLTSGFTKSNDEVYVEATEGKLKNLSKKKEELDSIDAELVGIWKISQKLYQRLLQHHSSATDARTKDYERAIADIAPEHPVHMLKIENLVWCEIDNETHLERAINEVLPRL